MNFNSKIFLKYNYCEQIKIPKLIIIISWNTHGEFWVPIWNTIKHINKIMIKKKSSYFQFFLYRMCETICKITVLKISVHIQKNCLKIIHYIHICILYFIYLYRYCLILWNHVSHVHINQLCFPDTSLHSTQLHLPSLPRYILNLNIILLINKIKD